MAIGALWHTRPIFITSTFKDMQAERDWLRDRVFPALEERLRARRTHLEPIDLRWGVETVSAKEEEAKELLVLKVCLAEVERSRPFLLALLGDRYGWVPPEERMEAAAREAGFEPPVNGRSVTDLEIDFGVLSSEDQRHRCRFYFREPLPYDELIAAGQMMPGKAAEYSEAHRPGEEAGSARLDALKSRIEQTLPDRVRHYQTEWDSEKQAVTGLEAWGEQVFEDLWQELEQETEEWSQAGDATWQAAERFTLEQFLEDRTRNFVGRETILNELEFLALSAPAEDQPWGACMIAQAGVGKSALFAALTRRLQENHDITVLAHAAGISPRSTQIDAMLRRWVEELEGIAGVTEALAEDANAEVVEQTFQSLLGRVSAQQRVILLIDALNQFGPTPRTKHLTWLPKLWPSNVRLIATAIPATASESLSQRTGVEAKVLPPLDSNEAGSIATTICQRHRRILHPEVLERLLNKHQPNETPAAGNALWLQLAVEELNLLDADDFARMDWEFAGTAEQKLHQLLLAVVEALPADVEGLYGWLLERAEELHGKVWALAYVNLIAVSRAGWRESDFRVLIPKLCNTDWDELRFAALRRTFRAHVVQRGANGQWDFAHTQLRLAVEHRNLADENDTQTLHHELVNHLEVLAAADPLRENELMVHLIHTNDRLRAARHYASRLSPAELAGANDAVYAYITSEETNSSEFGRNWAMAILCMDELSDEEIGVLGWRINDVLIRDRKDGFRDEIGSLWASQMALNSRERIRGKGVVQTKCRDDLPAISKVVSASSKEGQMLLGLYTSARDDAQHHNGIPILRTIVTDHFLSLFDKALMLYQTNQEKEAFMHICEILRLPSEVHLALNRLKSLMCDEDTTCLDIREIAHIFLRDPANKTCPGLIVVPQFLLLMGKCLSAILDSRLDPSERNVFSKKAKEYVETVLVLFPSSPAFVTLAGQHCVLVGENAHGISLCEKALELDPTYQVATISLDLIRRKIAGKNENMHCAICNTHLRISPAAGKRDIVLSRVGESRGVDKLIDELKKPARHICPNCREVYCPDCLTNMLCPICKARVGLG